MKALRAQSKAGNAARLNRIITAHPVVAEKEEQRVRAGLAKLMSKP